MRAGTSSRELVWSTPGGQARPGPLPPAGVPRAPPRAGDRLRGHLLDHAAPSRSPRRCVNRQDAPATARTARAARRRPAARARRFDRPRAQPGGREQAEDGRLLLGYRDDAAAAMTLGVGVEHLVDTAPHGCTWRRPSTATAASCSVTVDAEPGVPIRITKFVTYQTSRSRPPERARRALRAHPRPGRDATASTRWPAQQRVTWTGSGNAPTCAVDVDDDADLAAAGDPLEPLPGRAGDLARRGQRRAREGADRRRPTRATTSGTPRSTCCRSSCYTQPRIARNLLRFRYSMLAQAARPRARELGASRGDVPVAHDQRRGGVGLLPGRAPRSTTSTPTSPTPSAATSTSAATSASSPRCGAEMLVETARLWADLGFYGDGRPVPHPRRHRARRVHDGRQRQHLHEPAGAAEPALRGRRRSRRCGATGPDDYAAARRRRSSCATDEVTRWERAADAMYVPYDARARRPPAGRRASSTARCGTSTTTPRRAGSRCCCTTTRSSSTATRCSSRPTSCWPCSCSATSSPPRRSAANFEYYDRLTTRRLVAVGLHAEHRRRRGRRGDDAPSTTSATRC